jgi:putative membrane protein
MELLTQIAIYFMYLIITGSILTIGVLIYTKTTKYNELKLISEGNTSAAIALGGFILGITFVLASTIYHSVNIPEIFVWGSIGIIAQIILYFIISKLVFKLFNDGIEKNTQSYAIFLAFCNISLGVINAICII